MVRRVLIVDDEPNIVVSLDFLMRKQGYDTRTVDDGLAAVTVALDYRPDLVLLDVSLPGQDGFEVCRELRERLDGEFKIVMLTARGRETEVAKGLALGADAYVTKPFSTRELVDHVRQLMGTPE
jgi:DNA-binding response OmpR family regulator